MNNNNFYNPYHFVPLNADERGEITSSDTGVTAKTLYQTAGHEHLRHDHMVPGLISGTLTCELNTLTPTITGAEHEEAKAKDGAKLIKPFAVNNAMAIAGSSLRGMISSTYEIVTDSAMRVLDNTLLSGRVAANNALPAIGQIRIDPITKQYSIVPLLATAGCIKCDVKDNDTLEAKIAAKWKNVFTQELSWDDILGYYTSLFENGKIKLESSKIVKSQAEKQEHNIIYHSRKSPHYLNNTSCHKTLTIKGSVKKSTYTDKKTKKDRTSIKCQFRGVKVKNAFGNYVLTSKPFSDDALKTDSHKTEKSIAYILDSDVHNRKYNLPKPKKHHWLIPYSDAKLEKIKPIAVAQHIVDEWRSIATHIHSQTSNKDAPSTPYLPLHQQRGKADHFRDIEDGDLIYFNIDEQGRVNKLSYSSIWRDGYRSEHDYMGSKAPLTATAQRALTPAETLFGFVSEVSDDSTSTGHQSSAPDSDAPCYSGFASRVLFSNAVASEGYPDTRYVLPELSAPKAPSPAMYFAGRGYVNKHALAQDKNRSNPKKVQPSGWKRYIPHHQLAKLERYQPGQSYKNRSAVTPIPAACKLHFTVEIKNLTASEFRTLLFCLAPQDYQAQDLHQSEFSHSLGMGKPLGLGRVRISVTDFKDSQLPSFTSHSAIDNGQQIFSNWTGSTLTDEEETSCFDTHKAKILMKLGSTAFIQKNTPIHYPKPTPDRHPAEPPEVITDNESFRWFVQNERQKGGNQHLERLSPDNIPIKPLAGNKPKNTPGKNHNTKHR